MMRSTDIVTGLFCLAAALAIGLFGACGDISSTTDGGADSGAQVVEDGAPSDDGTQGTSPDTESDTSTGTDGTHGTSPDTESDTSTGIDAAPVADGGDITVQTCEGEAPSCTDCDSDVEMYATCEDGQWVCEFGSLGPRSECPEETCDMWGGELCCDADGDSVSALCPTPSQAYCADGSPPVLACGVCGDGECDPSENASDCPSECDP